MQLVIYSCVAAKPDEFCSHCGRTMRVDARRCEWCQRRIRRPNREPLPRPRRSCGHLKSRHKRYPWCRICCRATEVRRPIWYKFHLEGRYRPRFKRKPRPTSRRLLEKLAFSQECRAVRLLLFREAQGHSKNLSPCDFERYKAFRDMCYQNYFTRTRFAGREPRSFEWWRRRWWGKLLGVYMWHDVPKLLKES